MSRNVTNGMQQGATGTWSAKPAGDTTTYVMPDTAKAVPFDAAGVVPEEFAVDTLLGYDGMQYVPGDTLNGVVTTLSVGKEVETLPYRLYADNVLTVCLFFCFFLFAYVLSNGKRYLLQQLRNFFYVRERASLFAVETGSDIRYRLLLVLQTCIFLGVLFFDYSHYTSPLLFTRYSSLLLLGCYVGVVVLHYLLKMLLFSWMSWIFFDKQKNSLWIESYSLLYSLFGIALFPLVLLVVYFDIPNLYAWVIFIILLLLCELMLFYKCFNIFFNKMYGMLYFIVYLCALEIVPCFLLWQALITANSFL